MATKTWIATTSSTWATAASWSPSGVPAAGDDVIFNSSSGPCTVTANTTALLSLNFTGYTNTITINNSINLIVAGNVTLSSGMTSITPLSGSITMNTGTLTTNGHALGVWLRLATAGSTIQLADACVLNKGLRILGLPTSFITLRSSVSNTQIPLTLSNTLPTVFITGSISTTNLTVTAGSNIVIGMNLYGNGITSGTYIVSQTSGTPGGAGVYVVSASQTVASTTIRATLLTDQDIDYVNAIDLDSSGGQTFWNYKGTISNSSNWYIMQQYELRLSGLVFA